MGKTRVKLRQITRNENFINLRTRKGSRLVTSYASDKSHKKYYVLEKFCVLLKQEMESY